MEKLIYAKPIKSSFTTLSLDQITLTIFFTFDQAKGQKSKILPVFENSNIQNKTINKFKENKNADVQSVLSSTVPLYCCYTWERLYDGGINKKDTSESKKLKITFE